VLIRKGSCAVLIF